MNSPASGATIRRMEAADVDAVVALAGSLKDAPHWPPRAYLEALLPELSPRRIALVAAGPRGAPAGFAIASLVPPQAELETIAVALSSQRQGIGRRLLAAVVEELSRAGVRELLLEVRAANQPAQALYRSLGFAQTGRRPRYYADPVEDALLFARPLV